MPYSDRFYKTNRLLGRRLLRGWFTPLLMISLLLCPFACSRAVSKTRVIKLGHGLDPTHPVHLAMKFLAERVTEKSGHRLRIDIYPSEQLGSERQCLELLQIGSLGMTKVSSSVLEGFVPAMGVLGLPYLFRDEGHLGRVLESDPGRRLLLEGERFWLRGLCYYNAGSRSFYTRSRPILSPSDLDGLKIRTQQSASAVKMIQIFGGSAAPIAWGELYSALQQGVVDGAENNPPSFHLSRHYEVCKFYSLDEHTTVPDILLISTRLWASLSPDEQGILQEAAEESAVYQNVLWQKATETALAAVRKAGVQVLYPDKKPFLEKVLSLYEEYRKTPELYQLILNIQKTK